ncbi:L-sorbosone dehydrogenase [Aquipluma nitroreducens]|uniref:L-sorbosone dehydrogenase n=1 Tax=Aquipluma nitroreducens TaxID=2010828 RepID=A0A5K7S3N9_9BACT|nr:PQQ-dependent sugar dehydrogenase [Aquipluma nitroreducens]BBE15964.1 L-sorbosone dehydrogenase [Aquipluma nitroreducens]
MKTTIHWLIGLIFMTACQSNSNKTAIPEENNAELKLPEGFSALVFADNLGHARHLDVNENGDVYVSLSQAKNGGGIVCLRDENGDGKADIIKYHGIYDGTGIKLHKGYVYVGADTLIARYKLTEGELVPTGNPEIIATGFDHQNQHETKPITFDLAGNMYVTVGAPSNACQTQDRTKGSPGMDPCPILELHGGIWRFKDDVPNQDQAKDGYRYATGIRNAVAINWNNQENKLYALQHGRDQLSQFYPELYNDQQSAELPAEEFLLVEDGSNFGWPYCYYDGAQNKKVLAPEYGGDGQKAGRCAEADDPIMAFPAHMAPNDVLFYTGNMFPEKYKNGAFIAFHGSWNRAPLPQEGYYVVFVPFKGTLPSGKWEVFASGFAGVEVVKSPGDAQHRPCGLAQGPDGSLYVSDDSKGRIYRIFYNGK